MGVRDVLKISRKTFLNPTGWIGYNSLKVHSRNLYDVLRSLFSPAPAPSPIETETFEAAIKRMGLTEQTLQETAQTYYWYAIFFATLGVLLVLFAFYLLFQYVTFSGWLLALASSALFFSQAFRFHFWYFQIQRRKLGCTFAEWREAFFGKKG